MTVYRSLALVLLVKLDQKHWKKHLRYRGKKPIIYARCNKSIYGMVTAALLSYKKLVGHPIDWGFEMNLYERCCWNKMINKEQFTIVFHVDNLKLSHKDEELVSNIIANLESIYATIDPMIMHRGKLHHYLGMITDF